MIPVFQAYLIDHVIAQWIGALITGAIILAFLMLNAELSATQIYIYVLALVGSAAYEVTRDAAGFWSYCIKLRKFYRQPRDAGSIGPWEKRLSALHGRPVLTALAAIAASLAVVALVDLAGISYPPVIAALLVVGWFPLVIAGLATLVGAGHVEAIESGVQPAPSAKTRSASMLVFEDLCLLLLIHAAVLWSIYHNSQFSVAKGYLNPTLIVSGIILDVILVFVGLLKATQSRLPAIAGERLSGANYTGINARRVHSAGRVGLRFFLYLLLPVFWVPLACAVLDATGSTPRFLDFSLLVMLPVVVIFLVERARRLAADVASSDDLFAEYMQWRTWSSGRHG